MENVKSLYIINDLFDVKVYLPVIFDIVILKFTSLNAFLIASINVVTIYLTITITITITSIQIIT